MASEGVGDGADRAEPHVGVTHDAGLPDGIPAGLELGFDEQYPVRPLVAEPRDLLGDHAKGYERQVRHHEIERSSKSGWVDRPDVRPLDHRDSRIVTDPPVHLTVSDIDRHNVAGTALEHTVGEAACRRADVDDMSAAWVDPERIKTCFKLATRPAHELFGWYLEVEWFIGADKGRCLRLAVVCDPYETFVNGALCLGT